MAKVVNLQRGGLVAKGVVGFSWTTLFFGAFVPLFRGDWKWFLIMLIAAICTMGISNLVLCFIYNGIYTRDLLENKNYEPADEISRQRLIKAGISVAEG